MPRHTPHAPVAPRPVAPNAMIASAANVSRGALRPKSAGQLDWQRSGWNFYDTVGELRYGANWIGNALSRCTLKVMQRGDDGALDEVESGPAADALANLFGGSTGQSQALRTLGIHLTVPGESFTVAIPREEGDAQDGPGGPDEWLVLSTEEIRGTKTGVWSIDRGDGNRRVLPDTALIIRIWNSHPRVWVEADSSVRAVLPVLRELEQLTKHVAATIDSRLAGAGILLMPSEMTFDSPTQTEVSPETDPTADRFFAALATAMITPIEDRSDASAVVPILVKAPGALLGEARHLTFSTPFDSAAQGLRAEAIRRLALGMDLPPEIMLGQGDSNHWSAWQIDESAIKIHIEPKGETICDAYTRDYLWPVLQASGVGDDRFTYLFQLDTADLRLRPDHSGQAVELYDRLELSGDALRRETGFEEEGDRPTDEERGQIATQKIALAVGPLQGPAVEALKTPMKVPETPPPVSAAPPQLQIDSGPAETAPPLQSQRTPPQDNLAASVLASGELLTLRALERANNRISRRSRQRRTCEPGELDAALADAWTSVPEVAALLGVDPAAFQARLDTHARTVLASGADYDRAVLSTALFEATHG